MTLSLDTAYRSFGGEVEASSTPTICRLSDSRRHQLWAIALELGAAWQKHSEQSGRDYPSVKLDDPSFPASMAARFWVEPIEGRFEKVGTYEIGRVVSSLVNGLPPRYLEEPGNKPKR
ncbi:DUF736 family protein [Bradyrhizobium sp. 24]|nr:DUF736 family protein [Bradyrhizobium sp. 24]